MIENLFVKTFKRRIKPFLKILAALDFVLDLQTPNSKDLLPHLKNSKSQNFQDLFVLSHLELKRKGYFVEFGASNGIDLSNTFLLEYQFEWTGILAEPARSWHEALCKNRPNAIVEKLCIWKASDLLLPFNETMNKDLSTLDAFSDVDDHREIRQKGKKYDVTTISLIDLLAKNGAPNHIDYLSIDTEGSELEILTAFDFDRYTFGVITCEHNYTANREDIYKLLTSKGYTRKYQELSLWDDWYVKD